MRVSMSGLMALVGLVGAAACSSGSPGPAVMQGSKVPPGDLNPCNPDCNSGGGGINTAAIDKNPDGVPYPVPATGYGYKPRAGNAAGNVIQDFSFLGYPNATVSPNLSTIKLADYYDPCNKRYKLIHITMAAVWCGPCNQETDQIVSQKAQLAADKVVVIQALDDGPNFGVAATQKDLNGWISTHMSNFTEMLDPGHQNLGPFFDAAAIPWNANIDPRTMEILDSGEGLPADMGSTPGFMTDIQQGLMEVQSAPNYAIPSGACGG